MLYKKVNSLLLSITTLRFIAYFFLLFQDYFVFFWFCFHFEHLNFANDFFHMAQCSFWPLVESQRFEAVVLIIYIANAKKCDFVNWFTVYLGHCGVIFEELKIFDKIRTNGKRRGDSCINVKRWAGVVVHLKIDNS